MIKIAVLDDCRGSHEAAPDWSALMQRAEVVFFKQAFEDEDDALGSWRISKSCCRCGSEHRCRRR